MGHFLSVSLRRFPLKFCLRPRLPEGPPPLAYREVPDPRSLLSIVIMKHLSASLLMVRLRIHLMLVCADSSKPMPPDISLCWLNRLRFHNVVILIKFILILGAVQKAIHRHVNGVAYFLLLKNMVS